MKIRKIYLVLLGTGMMGGAVNALAADTGTVDVGKVTVIAKSKDSGQMVQEDAAKARSTVTHDALVKQTGTANGIDKLKYTPGVSVASNDETGLSGFKFTMRGMSGDQIGVTMDGVPVNDSGNYAMYPNLLGDPENLEEVFATQGTSDNDAPHIGSSGGNIGLVSLRPTKKFGVFAKQIFGSNDLTKTFLRLNTGNINGFQNYISMSHTEADKWKGAGKLKANKVELNSLWQNDGGDSVSTIIKWHKQENIAYVTPTLAQYQKDHKFDISSKMQTCKAGNGATYMCGSYYKESQNPFENITASMTSRFHLNDSLLLTIAPYYYVSNGGGAGSYVQNLNNSSNKGGIYDLSNLNSRTDYQQDGVLTSGSYYRPSWTETWRPGITTKLDWAINEEHNLQVGYWYERARQRQSKPYVTLNSDGSPSTIWANYDGSHQVKDANGNTVQGRNYFTVTPAQKLFLNDTWNATADLTLFGGISYSHVQREGHNRGSLYDQPSNPSASYSRFLPTGNVKYQINNKNSVFYNISENMRTPQNYALYNAGDSISTKPEISWNNELGWRYQTEMTSMSATIYHLAFNNRQVSTKNSSNEYILKNIGKVVNSGIELELGGKLPYQFNYYASYSYTKSEQKNNITTEGITLPTKGKQVAGVPKNILNLILGYDNGTYYGSLADHMVGKQYGDMTNDQSIPGFSVFDLSLGYRIPYTFMGVKKPVVRLTVNNLFNKNYLSGVDSTTFASKKYSNNGKSFSSAPQYLIGEQRSLELSFEASF
ncbi:TonB-dependent receptor [Celerinatantimonas yamalensis]|uniref:TonB-dependent receptor n=1 Tax=Celerinatantimonas yamalensis TaxID=559956 RepID=A0ABW9G7M2_9GAMM